MADTQMKTGDELQAKEDAEVDAEKERNVARAHPTPDNAGHVRVCGTLFRMECMDARSWWADMSYDRCGGGGSFFFYVDADGAARMTFEGYPDADPDGSPDRPVPPTPSPILPPTSAIRMDGHGNVDDIAIDADSVSVKGPSPTDGAFRIVVRRGDRRVKLFLRSYEGEESGEAFLDVDVLRDDIGCVDDTHAAGEASASPLPGASSDLPTNEDVD